MWPIRDVTGDVIAFGARKLEAGGDGPKYLNTPETPLFKKSSVLYGADLARREIAQHRQAVIVEGYTDVMACHLSGVPTAVATCGTSFGEGHIKILRRLIMDTDRSPSEVIFTFDGDGAGQRAALKAFDSEQKFVTQTYVAVQPDGLDPCDLRLKHGDAAVRDLIARRVPLYEFTVRSAMDEYDLDSAEGRLAALDGAARVVAGIKDEGLRKVYAQRVDRWLGLMDEDFVLARIGLYLRREQSRPADRPPGRSEAGAPARRSRRGAGAAAAPDVPARTPSGTNDGTAYDAGDPVVRVEREALKLAVQRPALCGPAFDALGADAFTVPVHAATFRLIAECGGVAGSRGDLDWAAQLRAAAPGDTATAFVTGLAVEPLLVPPRLDGDADAGYTAGVIARVAELAVSRQIVAVKSRLQRMNPVEEQAAYNRLFGDLIALEQRRKVLLERAEGATESGTPGR